MHPKDLIPGNCYFTVHFLDDKLLLPNIQTLLFQEKTTDDEGKACWLFGMPGSDPDDDDDPELARGLILYDEQLHQVHDINGLMRELSVLSDLHPIVPSQGLSPTVARGVFDWAATRSWIRSYLADDGLAALSISIRYVEEGVSIFRFFDSCSHLTMTMHLQRNKHAAEEAVFRAILAEFRVASITDRHMNHGRTRVLSFPVPADEEWILSLISRTFIDVWGLTTDQELQFLTLPRKSKATAGE